MSHRFDLPAYLQRVHHPAAPVADLASLCSLAIAHAVAIPFENLDPLLGVPVDLSLPALQRKLVTDQRGGYCFEQNLLFAAALRTLGFEVQGLIARVLWNRAEDAITAQTHMLLHVALDDGSWLVDVGFGSMTLAGALRLQDGIAQPTALEPFRLLQRSDEWRMQACVRGEWLTLYRFDLQPHELIDYEVANHYVSTHPDSPFVHHLSVARTTANCRLTLRDREFTIRHPEAEPERRVLTTTAEMRRVLEQEFLLRLPCGESLKHWLDALPDQPY